jgi:acetyl-CoA C-acetyltransferase
MERKSAIIGVGMTKFTSCRRETRSRAELAFAAVKAALDDAGLEMKDIDASVYTSVDGFEATVRPARTLEALGQGLNIPLVDVNTGGSAGGSGIKEAVHLIEAGIHDIVLVYGSPTFNSVVDNQQVLNTASPPIFEKPFGIGAVHMGAVYLSRYMRDHDLPERSWADVAAKNHRAAARNPYAHLRQECTSDEVLASPMITSPIRLLECCPTSSGACAMIFASEDRAKRLCDTPVWVRAIGSVADTFLSGFKTYRGFDKLEILAQRIYKVAGIGNPLKDFDVAELFNPFSGFELLEYEACGFCKEGEARRLLDDGVTDVGGELPVNMSGGVVCTNSGISASVIRHAEVALQLMGKAEGRQVKSPSVGLAHSWGGNLGQFHTLAVLTR